MLVGRGIAATNQLIAEREQQNTPHVVRHLVCSAVER